MNKLLVWFHSFPQKLETIIDAQLFEQIHLSVFQSASDTQPAKNVFKGNFSQFELFIKQQKELDEVAVILPGKEILYTQVSVPSKSRKRIMKALPFILEDKLMNDIQDQFIALGDSNDGFCQVAIVRRSIIQKIYDQFKKLSLPLRSISSETLQLPWYENKWTIAFLHNDVYVRTGEQSGFVTNTLNLEFVFDQSLGNSEQIIATEQGEDKLADNASETDKSSLREFRKPESFVIYSQHDSELVDKILSIAQKHSIDTFVEKSNLLKLALTKTNKGKKGQLSSNKVGINLLQGEFDSSNFKQNNVPFKRSLITAFALWFITLCGFMGYQWQIKSSQLHSLETELEQLYFQTFPDSKRLIDVRSQTQSHLKQLQQSSSSNDSFMDLLGLVGKELRQLKDIVIKSIHYNDGILQVEIQSKGFIFNQLKSKLDSQSNLQINEKSSSRIKGDVHSVLTFRMKQS